MESYRKFQAEVLAHATEGPKHADVLVDVCRSIRLPRLKVLTGGDPGNIDGVIDAQLDRLIVASLGNERLALFAAIAGLGEAMSGLHGG